MRRASAAWPWLICVIAVLLAGCSDDAVCPAPKEVSEIPLVRLGSHTVVPVVLNRQAAGLILDTGAYMTIVTPQAVSDLHVPVLKDAHFVEEGFAGPFPAGIADVPSVKLGGLTFRNVAAMIAPLSAHGLAEYPAYGLLGSDLLSIYDLDLDMGADRLVLYTADLCQPKPPWQGAYEAVGSHASLERFSSPAAGAGARLVGLLRSIIEQRRMIMIKVTLDGHHLTALVDTGAALTAVNQSTLGLSDAEMADGHRVMVGGMGLQGIALRTHRFGNLQIGTTSFGPIDGVVGDLRTGSFDMILGTDFLRKHRVFVAYQAGRLFIER